MIIAVGSDLRFMTQAAQSTLKALNPEAAAAAAPKHQSY